jgi:hypothetical protein
LTEASTGSQQGGVAAPAAHDLATAAARGETLQTTAAPATTKPSSSTMEKQRAMTKPNNNTT